MDRWVGGANSRGAESAKSGHGLKRRSCGEEKQQLPKQGPWQGQAPKAVIHAASEAEQDTDNKGMPVGMIEMWCVQRAGSVLLCWLLQA